MLFLFLVINISKSVLVSKCILWLFFMEYLEKFELGTVYISEYFHLF